MKTETDISIPAIYEIRKGGGKVVYGLRLPDGSVKVTCDCDVLGQAGHLSFVVSDGQALELFPMAENGGRIRQRHIQDILADVPAAVREVFVSGVTPLEWARDVEGLDDTEAHKAAWLKFRSWYDINSDCAENVAEYFGAPAVMVDGVLLEAVDSAAAPVGAFRVPTVAEVKAALVRGNPGYHAITVSEWRGAGGMLKGVCVERVGTAQARLLSGLGYRVEASGGNLLVSYGSGQLHGLFPAEVRESAAMEMGAAAAASNEAGKAARDAVPSEFFAAGEFSPSVVFVLNAAGLVVMWDYVETREKLHAMARRPGFSKGWKIEVVPLLLVRKAAELLAALRRLYDCPDLNLGNLELESELALYQAECALAGLSKIEEGAA